MLCYRHHKKVYNPRLERTSSQAYLSDQDMLDLELDNVAYQGEEGAGDNSFL